VPSRGMMPSDDLDAGWDADPDAAPPPTRTFDETELAEKTRSKTAPRPPTTAPPPDGGLSETIPPPMHENDYVQQMMREAGDSEPRFPAYRNQLATLMEIDPLRYDQPEEMRPPSGDAREVAPTIETVEETLDVEPDLLVNTMPPPSGGVDELDMLPFDEVLNAISQRPSDLLDTRPPPPSPRAPESSEVTIQAGLRLGNAPPPPKPPEELPYERLTLPGDRQSLADRPNDERAKMLRRLEAKDYMGALILAESLGNAAPSDQEVHRCAEECRAKLTDMYLGKLGERSHVPRVMIGAGELQHLALDHRAGFLISCIDGASSLDEVLDMSGMPALDTVRLLYELVQEGAIVVEPPPPRSSPR
jgi:hypothetical protein